MKKISVIVPVYNTEKYLYKCVDSILASTYTNLEVILVDDGSPDNAGRICDEYAEKDARVRVIHKANGGLSSARNAGLDAATGDYITFVDSDDYISCDIYDKLCCIIESKCVDIAMMGVMQVNEEYQEIDVVPIRDECISAYEFLKGVCCRVREVAVWNKLFKREVIGNYRFSEGKLNEDFLFAFEVLIGKKFSICSVSDVGYYYYSRTGSITKSGFGKSLYDAVYNTQYVKELAEKECADLVPYVGAYAAYQARTAILMMTKEQYRKNADFTKYCREVIKENSKYIKGSFMNKKERLFCRMYRKMPRFTKWFFDMIRCGRR